MPPYRPPATIGERDAEQERMICHDALSGADRFGFLALL
jgi:hypothetical protein